MTMAGREGSQNVLRDALAAAQLVSGSFETKTNSVQRPDKGRLAQLHGVET